MANRIATLLLLLVSAVCSVNSVAGEAPLAPSDARLLRQEVVESVTTDASSSHFSSGSGSLDVNATISTEAETHETEHESPTTMSFVGPALAGVLAIVLIGAVVTFKNRMGK